MKQKQRMLVNRDGSLWRALLSLQFASPASNHSLGLMFSYMSCVCWSRVALSSCSLVFRPAQKSPFSNSSEFILLRFLGKRIKNTHREGSVNMKDSKTYVYTSI